MFVPTETIISIIILYDSVGSSNSFASDCQGEREREKDTEREREIDRER